MQYFAIQQQSLGAISIAFALNRAFRRVTSTLSRVAYLYLPNAFHWCQNLCKLRICLCTRRQLRLQNYRETNLPREWCRGKYSCSERSWILCSFGSVQNLDCKKFEVFQHVVLSSERLGILFRYCNFISSLFKRQIANIGLYGLRTGI